MKNRYIDIDTDYIYIALLISVVIIAILVYSLDKKNCEKNGGIYVWEWHSEGSKCHLKGDK